MEITFTEVMPLGEEGATVPTSSSRARLGERFTLEPLSVSTSGPARYARAAKMGGRVGFITPLTHNLSESCNRVRVTCTGTLYMCLARNDPADLRTALRSDDPDAALDAEITEAVSRKPEGHDFVADRLAAKPRVGRMMGTTGAEAGATVNQRQHRTCTGPGVLRPPSYTTVEMASRLFLRHPR